MITSLYRKVWTGWACFGGWDEITSRGSFQPYFSDSMILSLSFLSGEKNTKKHATATFSSYSLGTRFFSIKNPGFWFDPSWKQSQLGSSHTKTYLYCMVFWFGSKAPDWCCWLKMVQRAAIFNHLRTLTMAPSSERCQSTFWTLMRILPRKGKRIRSQPLNWGNLLTHLVCQIKPAKSTWIQIQRLETKPFLLHMVMCNGKRPHVNAAAVNNICLSFPTPQARSFLPSKKTIKREQRGQETVKLTSAFQTHHPLRWFFLRAMLTVPAAPEPYRTCGTSRKKRSVVVYTGEMYQHKQSLIIISLELYQYTSLCWLFYLGIRALLSV